MGQVGVVSNGGTLGFSTAALSLFFLEDLNFNRPLYLLAGLQAGTGAGIWMAHGSDWSGSRASLVLLGGGVGALTLWGATALITGNDLISDDMLLAQLWGWICHCRTVDRVWTSRRGSRVEWMWTRSLNKVSPPSSWPRGSHRKPMVSGSWVHSSPASPRIPVPRRLLVSQSRHGKRFTRT